MDNQKPLSEYTSLELANLARDGENNLKALERGLIAIYGELARRQIEQARAEDKAAGLGPKEGEVLPPGVAAVQK
jgi:hypothetical protein